jgi:hypothetical protein
MGCGISTRRLCGFLTIPDSVSASPCVKVAKPKNGDRKQMRCNELQGNMKRTNAKENEGSRRGFNSRRLHHFSRVGPERGWRGIFISPRGLWRPGGMSLSGRMATPIRICIQHRETDGNHVPLGFHCLLPQFQDGELSPTTPLRGAGGSRCPARGSLQGGGAETVCGTGTIWARS